jgi:hypothetical protein
VQVQLLSPAIKQGGGGRLRWPVRWSEQRRGARDPSGGAVASGSGEQVNEIVNATLRLRPLELADLSRWDVGLKITRRSVGLCRTDARGMNSEESKSLGNPSGFQDERNRERAPSEEVGCALFLPSEANLGSLWLPRTTRFFRFDDAGSNPKVTSLARNKQGHPLWS